MIQQRGKTIAFGDDTTVKLDKLPAKNMLVKQDPNTGNFYLEIIDDFTLPKKIYGNVDKKVERYLRTFKEKSGNLGIMLKGLKGTGKSLLAKKLCISSGLPIIIITTPFAGTAFETFLSNIKQECVIFIDEFEKTYSGGNEFGKSGPNAQDKLLTILDGVFESKKIFLLTANNKYKINDALINRPGRIHYLEEYGSLPWDIIEEIINDLLVNKKEKDGLEQVLCAVSEVNMDCLTSLIWEMNQYDESAKESFSVLNISPEDGNFDISWVEENVTVLGPEGENIIIPKVKYTGVVNNNPLLSNIGGVRGMPEQTKETRNLYLSDKYVSINMDNAKIKIKRDLILIKYKEKQFTATKKKRFVTHTF